MSRKRITIHDVKRRLIEDGRGIEIAESSFKGMTQNRKQLKAVFKCSSGHFWNTRVASVLLTKSGCPKCALENQSNLVRLAQARPEVRAKMRAAAKEISNRPEIKALRIAAILSPASKAKSRATMRTPASKAKRSAAMKAAHARPESKARILASYNRPDVIEKLQKNGGWHDAKWYRKHGYETINLYKIGFIYEGRRIEKVGVSCNAKLRWSQLNTAGAKDIRLIAIEEGTPEVICKREREIKKASYSNRAEMPDDFHGRSECFTQIIDPKLFENK